MDGRSGAGGSVNLSAKTSSHDENRRFNDNPNPGQAEFRSARGKGIGTGSYIECFVGCAVHPDALRSGHGERPYQLHTPLVQPRTIGDWTGLRNGGACDNGKIRTEWNTVSRDNWIVCKFGRVRGISLFFGNAPRFSVWLTVIFRRNHLDSTGKNRGSAIYPRAREGSRRRTSREFTGRDFYTAWAGSRSWFQRLAVRVFQPDL